MSSQPASHGRELHREFVGMLFALAIAEVAVEAANLVNSGLPFDVALPGYSHLFLSAIVIASSWVGWGWSDHSLSDVKNVFNKDFVELLLDLWLVILYFFIVKGAELPVETNGVRTITPSAANEVFWIMIVFGTYLLWDFWTKLGERDQAGRSALVQRWWGTIVCAGLSVLCYSYLENTAGSVRVVLVDACLVSLVVMFRAMKAYSLSDTPASGWVRTGSLFTLWLMFFVVAAGFIG
jgi:hypothetical protein